MKKILAILIAAVLLLQAAPLSALAVGELPEPDAPERILRNGEAVPQEVPASDGTENTAEAVRATAAGTVSGRLGLTKPTMAQLRELLDAVPAVRDLFATGADLSEGSYHPAVLQSAGYTNTLTCINYFRTAAGVDKISFTDDLNLSASWGALVLAMGDQFTHYPTQPKGMSDEDYQKGYYATSHSNISWCRGYAPYYVLETAVWGQMEDEDSGNIPMLGHRRWLLDPRTKTMGVGSAQGTDENEYYTVIRVMGDGVTTQSVTDYDFISWPASGNNISETFLYDVPWSITLNPARYSTPDASKVQVKLTRKSDGKVWTFSKNTDVSSIGEEYDYFNVNNQGYGISNCIVFRPACSDFSSYDGEYVVDVTGITDASGNAATLHYSVLFAPYSAPEFQTQNLVLSGQIGVNFFMDLDSLTEAEREAGYMEFSISGKGGSTSTDTFDPNHMNASKKYYGFTCYVKSIQMAETITATYHYGDGKTISKTYSVEEYFQAFEEHASAFDQKTTDLIHAIADYGHYMQIYLADVNHFDIGTDYAESSRYYVTGYDYDAIKTAVTDNAIDRNLTGSNVEKANYRLQLGSETTLDVFLKTTDGSAPTNVKVKIEELVSGKTTEKAYAPVRQDDGRYLITIPNISAHKLGDTVTITGTAGGSFSVAVSPLSFVRDVLTYNTDTASKDGLCSLYAYYAATVAYKQ